MKKALFMIALISALLATPMLCFAEDTSPLSFNVSVTSDYRFRGISQTRLKPALQGGVDYAPASGFYVGAWASTIQWIKDNGVKGPVELDIYGGYKGEIQKDFGYDVGLLQYAYVGNKLADTGGGGVYKNADTTEVYGALTYGPVSAKLSYALTDLFGNYDFVSNRSSRGSIYAEVNGSFDLGSGFALVPHIGHQKVSRIAKASYTDYQVAVVKDLGKGFSLSGAVVGTDADKSFYVPGAAANSTSFLGKTAAVVSVKVVF
ncbi:MAG TPA: TorF family putative porin [Caldimonas sp.]